MQPIPPQEPASPEMKAYLEEIEVQTGEAYVVAQKAREKGFDPEKKVDIPIAHNMAERVEGIVSAAAPEIVGTRMTARILELEKQYGAGAWEVALLIAKEVAQEKFCSFSDKKKAMEVGIRTGMAYSTAGIVAAPLEGFIELRIKKTSAGKEYFSVFYAGPIRGAGGTAASVSVLIADYVRKQMGYAPFDPTEDEIKRYVTEVRDYHERITNLQYFPSEQEIEYLVRRIPVEINGDPTEQLEVSNHKDLPRVETNRIRGGVCLVLAEGIAQKAPKLWKRLQKWGADFSLEWDFLKDFLELQKSIKAEKKQDKKEQPTTGISPNYVYIKDLVAGRPVLTHPMRHGGFRLRMGRTRTSGFSATALHPATQIILDSYIAVGTQLKVERPGKAASVTVCDTIEGPIVKLKNGDVVRLFSIADAKACNKEVDKILFLGDILYNYGDFSENGHVLVPVGYCEEWHVQDVEKACSEKLDVTPLEKQAGLIRYSSAVYEKIAAHLNVSLEEISSFFENYFLFRPSAATALALSSGLGVPLHPLYTWHWGALSGEEFVKLGRWLSSGKLHKTEAGDIDKIILLLKQEEKALLEKIGLPHKQTPDHIVIEKQQATILLAMLLLDESFVERLGSISGSGVLAGSGLDMLNTLSPFTVKDKSGTFIGARMGRPEKSKMRKLTGSPHLLFPVGDEGGRLRSFQAAIAEKKVTGQFPFFTCVQCSKETIYSFCETCREPTKQLYFCKECGPKEKPRCPPHGPCTSFYQRPIDINHYFQSAVSLLGLTNYPDLIKGVRGTANKDHTPEHLAKGILRAKHDIYVNKDGTTRYDMSELPLTHFKPCEIETPLSQLKKMGYVKDIFGKSLEDAEQILELKPQDLIIPSGSDSMELPGDEVLFRIANFVDELLQTFYKLPPFYCLKEPRDIVGHLVIGLAPHISAGIVGRIIGFSKIQGLYAHPLYHAAMRRDCDGDEACIMLLMDALLNFSRQFLPDARGSRTMDSPLVLTIRLVPSEVDDMVLGLDTVTGYPLSLYEAGAQYKKTGEIDIEQLRKRLDTPQQYENIGYTHPITNINDGVRVSAYKILPSMEEKLRGQMLLAEKIIAVDETDVATRVIEKHFIRDIRGNLRKFSMQEFRCVKCNEKFRRPPLIGKCTVCKGNLLFTISEGSIVKYLEPSLSLARKYNVPVYVRQNLELTKRRIEEVFGKDKEKQSGLGAWFG
ncbi:MAG: DNA polymerase II large subunit [Candidatus Woesearchaeota archaeon]|nr:DNA polymerase II large subunit [Candidatus Woesearchaeota archaeon]